MDVQIRHLAALVALADAGTFTGAAGQLGVSQAAVSRTVAALETTLGVRLVQRTTRHVALTAAGTRILPQARRVLDDLAHLRRLAERARSEIRVGYAWAALGKHTRRVQKAWSAAHPALPLVFVHANDPTVGLGDGSADVAVVRHTLRDTRFTTARFTSARVGTERRFAAVATDNPLARKRSVTLAEVARFTVAVHPRQPAEPLDLPGPEQFPPDLVGHHVRHHHGRAVARTAGVPGVAQPGRVADADRGRAGGRRHG